jgi:hypothetical protein
MIKNKRFILTDSDCIDASGDGWTLKRVGDLKLMVEGEIYERDSLFIWYDGWIVPRNECYSLYRGLKPEEIIHHIVTLGEVDFHKHIKGSFTLVVVYNGCLTIITDFHGISKVYYRAESRSIEYSNDYSLLLYDKSTMEDLFPFILALFQHPVGGILPHAGIRFIDVPSYIRVNQSTVSRVAYWSPATSINRDAKSISVSHLVAEFQSVVQNTCDYLELTECAITLTGGRDTRSVLSALLNTNLVLRPFTFGNPSGKDVLVSRSVSDALNLNFTNPNINPLSAEHYDVWVSKLMHFKNPFISLHRTHRLQAFSEMRDKYNSIQFLFMGCMGGDYSKGISFNDYIVTTFLRLYYIDRLPLAECIRQVLTMHKMNYTDEIVKRIEAFIDEIVWLEKDWSKSAEMKLAFYFVGSTHDVQDMMLARYCGFNVFSPFMDIDFIEKQFQSDYNLFHAARNSINPMKRLRGGELQAQIICSLSEELGRLPLANDYKPKDILGNRWVYTIKRIHRQIIKRPNFPTFSYGSWFVSWVRMKVEGLGLINFVDNASNQHPEHEGYWHKITNVIWLELFKRELDVRNSEKRV